MCLPQVPREQRQPLAWSPFLELFQNGFNNQMNSCIFKLLHT